MERRHYGGKETRALRMGFTHSPLAFELRAAGPPAAPEEEEAAVSAATASSEPSSLPVHLFGPGNNVFFFFFIRLRTTCGLATSCVYLTEATFFTAQTQLGLGGLAAGLRSVSRYCKNHAP